MKITPIAAASMMGAVALIALPAIAHADDSYLFLSPSATIGCAMENDDRDATAYAVCRIQDPAWVAPPRPLACQANDHWGNALILDRQDGAGVVCYQETPPDPALTAPTLNYGQTHTVGAITCDSEPAGVTCTDSSTGHFFFDSRESYQLG